MLNLIDTTGSILLDGVDITTVPRSRLRRAITVIPQDSVQTSGSVRDNITLFVLQDESETTRLTDWYMHYVLEAVGLEKHVSKHGGLDAPMSDMQFKPDQRQLFDVARAMLHKIVNCSKIVLIDEVTSEMNYKTDCAARDAMSKIFKGCTRIVASQRVTFINDFDAIIPLGKGAMMKADKKTDMDKDEDTSDQQSSQPTTVRWVGQMQESSDASPASESVLVPAAISTTHRT